MNALAPTDTASSHKVILRPPVIAAVIVLLMAAAGSYSRFGPNWRYLTDGVTAFTVILLVWEVQRQRQNTARQTTVQIEELLRLLRNAKPDLSATERKTIETELQRLQIEVLSRAALKR